MRWPPSPVPPVYVETDRPLISSKLMMNTITARKTAVATITIHFQGSRCSASRQAGGSFGSGGAGSSAPAGPSAWPAPDRLIGRAGIPARAACIRAKAAAWARATRSRLIRME